jgi:uncharacterized Fe-S cluster-containing MiaB family protein
MQLEQLRKKVSIQIKLHPEHIDPETCLDDEAHIASIREESQYNPWAWCMIEVIASYKEISESSFLGACTYKDEAHFKSDTGSYNDMKDEAIEALYMLITSLVKEWKQ